MALTNLTKGTVVGSEGGSATTNLAQGLCKAWCYFDGTAGTPAFDDSFNGASLTDVNTGQYDMNFTSSMSNATYAGSLMIRTETITKQAALKVRLPVEC